MPIASPHHEAANLPNGPQSALHGSVARAPLRTATPPLGINQVHIWTLIPESVEIAAYTELLSSDEMERARRFRFAWLSERFVCDHARLRLLLSGYLDQEPQTLRFVENAQGKPRIHDPVCRLRFNMSHTEGLTLMAFCLDAEIGVDVEKLRVIEDCDQLAAMNFSSTENIALQAQPESERNAAFLRCWTRKEAYIKARGEGLSLPLDGFSVTLGKHEQAALTHCAWDMNEPARWMLQDLQPLPGYAGALAIERGAWSISQHRWGAVGSPAAVSGVLYE